MNRRASRTLAAVSGVAILAAVVVACGDGYDDDGDGWYGGGGFGPVMTETHIVSPGRTEYRTRTRTVTSKPKPTTTRSTRSTVKSTKR